MSILAEYLFGSHARRDYSDSSDIDLLSIVSENKFSTNSFGKLNFSYYPAEKFLEAAGRGDLFVMHIVREAVVTYDPDYFHQNLLEKFCQKSDYSDEIKKASDLGWYLAGARRTFKDNKMWNRRIAWCVRTIVIAQSAEYGKPVFSAESLANFINFPGIRLLLDRKNFEAYSPDARDLLEKFLTEHGAVEPIEIKYGKNSDAWWYFRKSNNTVALSTMDSFIDSVEKDVYGFI